MNWIKALPVAGFFLLIILISGRFIFLQKRGIHVSSGGNKAAAKMYLLYFLFFLILLLWLFEMVNAVFSFPFSLLPKMIVVPVIQPFLLQISGAVFVFCSLIIMLLTLLHFKDSLRFGLDKTNQGNLITGGIFSVARNPFFLSINLYFLGTAFIIPGLFFIGFALLAIVSIHFFILKEEKFLRKVYGKDYENYIQKVRRYF